MNAAAELPVAVLGAGTMGAGIAQACLAAGHRVALFDPDAQARASGRERIQAGLARSAVKGRLTQVDEATASGNLTTSDTLVTAVAEAAVVIEAVPERLELKRTVWNEVGAAAGSDALLATNTSGLSVTELGTAAGAPDRFVGLHFFNPVPVLPLVELVLGERTDATWADRAEAFARGLGKEPVRCLDRPGFLVNRLLIPYLNEAARLADEGTATPEAIDKAMRLGANLPIGPLALADLIGIDVVIDILENLQVELGDPRYHPAPLLRRMVRAGRIGKKSGEGFYRYQEETP